MRIVEPKTKPVRVPVRFDADRIATSLAGFQAGEIPAIPVVEVRV